MHAWGAERERSIFYSVSQCTATSPARKKSGGRPFAQYINNFVLASKNVKIGSNAIVPK